MIDLLSTLLGYILGTVFTGLLVVFVLGWTSNNMDQVEHLEKLIEELEHGSRNL